MSVWVYGYMGVWVEEYKSGRVWGSIIISLYFSFLEIDVSSYFA